jgi:hypothetical protein
MGRVEVYPMGGKAAKKRGRLRRLGVIYEAIFHFSFLIFHFPLKEAQKAQLLFLGLMFRKGTCVTARGGQVCLPNTDSSCRQWKMRNEKWKMENFFEVLCCWLSTLRSTHGLKNTFNIPFFAARCIPYTPRASGYSSLMRLSISIAPFLRRSRAGCNRPQREPTMLISSTTNLA